MIAKAGNKDICDFKIGDTAEITWLVTDKEIADFAELSGDHNPLHIDKIFANSAGFKDCVVHGFLLGSKLSALLGMHLPGKRCLIVEQKLAYPEPAYVGDTLNYRVNVININVSIRVIELKVSVTKFNTDPNQRKTVARGKVICKILS